MLIRRYKEEMKKRKEAIDKSEPEAVDSIYDSLTVSNIKVLLDYQGIEYKAKDTKDALILLLENVESEKVGE